MLKKITGLVFCGAVAVGLASTATAAPQVPAGGEVLQGIWRLDTYIEPHHPQLITGDLVKIKFVLGGAEPRGIIYINDVPRDDEPISKFSANGADKFVVQIADARLDITVQDENTLLIQADGAPKKFFRVGFPEGMQKLNGVWMDESNQDEGLYFEFDVEHGSCKLVAHGQLEYIFDFEMTGERKKGQYYLVLRASGEYPHKFLLEFDGDDKAALIDPDTWNDLHGHKLKKIRSQVEPVSKDITAGQPISY